MAQKQTHWLYRRDTIVKLWIGSLIVLAAVTAVGFLIDSHPHFGFDSSDYAFYATYGFATCVAMVVIAKILGILIKRPDDYYDDE
jgi:hypothetical protein